MQCCLCFGCCSCVQTLSQKLAAVSRNELQRAPSLGHSMHNKRSRTGEVERDEEGSPGPTQPGEYVRCLGTWVMKQWRGCGREKDASAAHLQGTCADVLFLLVNVAGFGSATVYISHPPG
jgi:hypothetical protein